jgi:WD40 repeat protein
VLPAGETNRLESPHDVEDLAFSPDGRTLVASAHGTTSPVWAIVDPVAHTQLTGFDYSPASLALRNDGLLAVGSLRGAVWFWQTGHCPTALQQVRSGTRPGDAAPGPGPNANPTAPSATAISPRPTSLAFDDQGRLLLVDSDALQCWDQPPRSHEAFRIALPLPANAAEGVPPLFRPPSYLSLPMARTPDGRTLFIARQLQIMVWHASEPGRLQSLTLPNLPNLPDSERDRPRRVDPTEFDRSGRRGNPAGPGLGPGGERDGRRGWLSWLKMVAAPDGKRLYLIENPDHRVRALALEGDQVRWLDWPLDIRATTLALSPDGRTLAVADRGGRPGSAARGQPGSIALIDTARGTEIARLAPGTDEAEGPISALAFAPGGGELAAGTQQGEVELWSLDHLAAPQIHLPSHRGRVAALAFDPHGRRLASGSDDRTVAVWDLSIMRDELGRLGLAW